MLFKGESRMNAPREKVWGFISDPRSTLKYVPMIQSLDVESDDKFRMSIGVAVGWVKGVFNLDGDLPVNPSGGVLSTNCIGATGLLRVGEAALQIFGEAEHRQVDGARLAMTTGFGGCFWSDALILGADRP